MGSGLLMIRVGYGSRNGLVEMKTGSGRFRIAQARRDTPKRNAPDKPDYRALIGLRWRRLPARSARQFPAAAARDNGRPWQGIRPYEPGAETFRKPLFPGLGYI
jgi:hypothetical protein